MAATVAEVRGGNVADTVAVGIPVTEGATVLVPFSTGVPGVPLVVGVGVGVLVGVAVGEIGVADGRTIVGVAVSVGVAV